MIGATGLALAGAIRLVTEPLRPSLGSGPVAWYVAAIGIGVVLTIALSLRTIRRLPPV